MRAKIEGLALAVHVIARSGLGREGQFGMRIVKVVIMLGAFAGLTGAFFGCGTARPDAASGDGTVNPGNDTCTTPGQARTCKYVISENNDVRTCAEGSQTCINGYWSPCSGEGRTGPSLLQSVPIRGGALGTRNINPATDGGPACANPCDPACTGFNERCPDGGVDAGDAASQTTFPPTGMPTCGTALTPSTSSCDCDGLLPACGMACSNTSGCAAVARGLPVPHVANFSCNSVTGLCDFKCETGAVCNITCNSVSTCSTTCLPGSVCNVSCNSTASCPVNCAPGAVCLVNQCTGSNCPISSLGVDSNQCFRTPQTDFNNLVTPGVNPGFQNKAWADQCQNNGGGNPDARRCEVGPFGANSNDVNGGKMASTCNADSYCAPQSGLAGPGCCQAFAANQTHASQTSGGLTCTGALPDLTFPGACKLPSGEVAVVICNRGNDNAQGPIWAGEGGNANGSLPHNSGTAAAPTCYGTASGVVNWKCRYDGLIPPGRCVAMLQNSPLGTGCGGAAVNGNSVWVVNGPSAPNTVAECTLDVKNAVNATQPDQPGCANNLTAFGAPGQLDPCVGTAVPSTFDEQYVAVCGPGQRPKWTTLGWDAITPSDSRIEFHATLQGNEYDGGLSAPVGPILIGRAKGASPYTQPVEGPAVCRPDAPTTGPFSTTNPECPKPLVKTLGAAPPAGGGPNALYYERLSVGIFFYPSSNGLSSPTLNNWWISYSCVDYE